MQHVNADNGPPLVKTLVISLFNHTGFRHLVEIPSVILRRFLFVKGLYETS